MIPLRPVIYIGLAVLVLVVLFVSKIARKRVLKELSDKESSLKEWEFTLKTRDKDIRMRDAQLHQLDHDLSRREYDLSVGLLQAQNGNNSFRRKNIYTSSLRAYEQELLERENNLEKQVLQRISIGVQRSFGSVSDSPIFRDFNNYDAVSNPRLHSALTERMTVNSLRFPSCKITGSSGATYDVSLDSCTCPDYQNRHAPCKHMYRLAMHFGLLLQVDDEWQRRAIDGIEKKNAQSQAVLKQELKQIRSERMSNERILHGIKAQSAVLAAQQQEASSTNENLQRILSEKSINHPWAAAQYADLLYALDLNFSKFLRDKKNPALKASEQVSEYARELRTERRISKELQYKLAVYETSVPWLSDLAEDISPEEFYEMASREPALDLSKDQDNARSWLSNDEYRQLSSSDRNQLALDRWKNRKKTNWEAGRDFERYVGYLYEQKGYTVQYAGALFGVNDLGRDLIASKNAEVIVIQCKRWKEQKTIHEKHIFQLHGSVVVYSFEHPLVNARGLLATTCPISDLAQQYADYLSIEVDSSYISADIFDYPMIKCNIGNTGEKIYHLPFDQQYDRVIITPGKGEFYALTVKEAEENGFRRAFRWHSS